MTFDTSLITAGIDLSLRQRRRVASHLSSLIPPGLTLDN